MDGWSPAEKVAHFLDALTILEDNLHCIDRLAVALTEAERAATAGGDQGAAMARSRSRAMLLHYAVLRGMLTHPTVLLRGACAPHGACAGRDADGKGYAFAAEPARLPAAATD